MKKSLKKNRIEFDRAISYSRSSQDELMLQNHLCEIFYGLNPIFCSGRLWRMLNESVRNRK